MFLFYIVFGIVVGILSALLGVGGGIVVVPILSYLGFLASQAAGTSSMVILLASFLSFVKAVSSKIMPLKIWIALVIPALIVSQLGVFIASFLPENMLVLFFCIFLVLNIYLMILKEKAKKIQQDKKSHLDRFGLFLFLGSLAGFLGGLFGVGGGIVLVPLLLLLGGVSMKMATLMSLGTVFFVALSSMIGHAFYGNVLWDVGLWIGLGSLLGSRLGLLWVNKLKDDHVFWGFLGLVILFLGMMFVKFWTLTF